MSKKFNITYKNIKNYSKKFNNKKTNKVFKNVNTKVPLEVLTLRSDYIQNKKKIFEKNINIKTRPTNQENSGRCWIFAFLNVMRIPMIKKYNLSPDFEFSQNYLFFYHKLEQANFFLNYIYDTKNEKINSLKNFNLNEFKIIKILDNLTNDGGQWNIFANLIEKYGIVPKSIMDDHYHSKNSKELHIFFNNFLRKEAKFIRNTNLSKEKTINESLEKCYKILVIFLGEPPNKITWQYYENKKNNKIQKTIQNITPLDFYNNYVPYKTKDKVCLINYPCNYVDFYKLYTIDLAFQIIGSRKIPYLNVPIETILNLCKKSIDKNEAVWCGIDWNKYKSTKKGFLDKKAFNFNDVFGFNNSMTKCDSLDYRQSSPTHAVILRGYNFDKGKTQGFLVENSHGIYQDKNKKNKENDFNENLYMSENWFKDYVYEIVIDKSLLNNKLLNSLKQKPILLPFWNPFGNLMN